MNMLRKPTKRRAVSPVIATVVLVAVTITVAVAVSYWMSGIAGQYTSFEKVEIQSAICTYDKTKNYWEIEIKLKNSGTKTSTITDVFVNDVLAGPEGTDHYTPGTITANADDAPLPLPIESGNSGTVTVWIAPGLIPDSGGSYITLSSGTTVNIKIHSAGGMDYIRLVQLT